MPYDTSSLEWWLDALSGARKGSDRSWVRECERMVSVMRREIARKTTIACTDSEETQEQKIDIVPIKD